MEIHNFTSLQGVLKGPLPNLDGIRYIMYQDKPLEMYNLTDSPYHPCQNNGGEYGTPDIWFSVLSRPHSQAACSEGGDDWDAKRADRSVHTRTHDFPAGDIRALTWHRLFHTRSGTVFSATSAKRQLWQNCWQKYWCHKPTDLLAHWQAGLWSRAYQDINKHTFLYCFDFFPTKPRPASLHANTKSNRGSTVWFHIQFPKSPFPWYATGCFHPCQARTETHSWQMKLCCFRCFRIAAALFI